MTTALCLNCGETKFGAFCSCRRCGVESSGDQDLDIFFSDHRLSVGTLMALGEIVKQLARHSDDPEIRWWAFISYLSAHPAALLSATAPTEISDDVYRLLAEAQLPIVKVELKPAPADSSPPQTT